MGIDPSASSSPHHPSALYRFSLVEFFERMALGAVLPLFVLYLHEHCQFQQGSAIALSSGFLAASYLASLPGGYLADRVLGPAWAARIGLMVLVLGFLALAIGGRAALWPALGALLVGQGLFKPSIMTLIGGLYPNGGHRREAGFALFYVAVNLGTFVGPLLAESVRIRWGWTSIFAGAGMSMLPALMILMFEQTDAVPAFANATQPVSILSGRHHERARSHAVLMLCGVAVVFWLAFQQTATTLTFLAENHTPQRLTILGRSILVRPGHFAALHAGFVIGFTPVVMRVMSWLRVRQLEPSTPRKMIWGFLLTAAAFVLVAVASFRGGVVYRVSAFWLGGCFAFIRRAIAVAGRPVVSDGVGASTPHRSLYRALVRQRSTWTRAGRCVRLILGTLAASLLFLTNRTVVAWRCRTVGS